ncbi:MAG TPA: hypothetical protein VF495_19480 [Phenylobacterium sp.]
MIGRPGSTLWLLHHELRLSLRRFGRQRGGRKRGPVLTWVFTLALPILLTASIGLPVGLGLRGVDIQPTPLAAVIALFVLLSVFTLTLSQTLSAAVDALYERADLDLLFSSPLDPRTVMTVRFLGVAASVFWIFGYFVTGPIVVIAAFGHPTWLASLVVLFAIALAAAGVGLLLASALFRALGPRRTRTLAQVLAAMIGAAFFLVAQARNILGGAGSKTAWQQVMDFARTPSLQVPGLDWPLRALLGEPLPLLAAVAVGAGIFWIASQVLGPSFATDAAAAAGAGRGGSRKAPKTIRPFAVGAYAATLRKELRLLLRDPALISQVLLRVLYILPLGFLLVRNAGQGASYLLPGGAAGLTLLAGQVAGSLAWITISAEDAPDLLASAPAPISLVRRGKLAASSLPLAVLLAPFLLPLLVISPLTGVAAVLGCAATTWAAGMINIWWQRPAKRSDFRTRHRASWFVTWSEVLVTMFIAAATGLLAAGLWWLAWLPALIAAGALLALRRSDAKIAEALRAAS